MRPPKELGWTREKLQQTYTLKQLIERTQELLEQYPSPRELAIGKLLVEISSAMIMHVAEELKDDQD
jgi:hypothetical protein